MSVVQVITLTVVGTVGLTSLVIPIVFPWVKEKLVYFLFSFVCAVVFIVLVSYFWALP